MPISWDVSTVSDRFYCPTLTGAEKVVLQGDEARHLARVSRRKPGDRVEIFDGRGRGVQAQIESIQRDEVWLTVLHEVQDRVQSINLHLFVAPPKGDRFDWLVEKATELGIASLTPIRTSRTIVDPRSTKIDRLRRLVIESTKQCGRNNLMDLGESTPFSQILQNTSHEVRFLGHAEIRIDPTPLITPGGSVALAIGPEGGWTYEELGAARQAAWLPVPFGPTRLRIETAAIVGAASLFDRVSRTGSVAV